MENYKKLQEKQRALALTAAEKSLVLLKNDEKTLPAQQEKIKNIIFIGETNDLGIQNGGWTINWQGQKRNQYFEGKDKISSGANTVQEAVLNRFKNKPQVLTAEEVKAHISTLSSNDTLAVAVIAEPPYAEYMGDIGNNKEADRWYEKGAKSEENLYMPIRQSHALKLEWKPKEAKLIDALRAHKIPVVTIIYSGRPIVLTQGEGGGREF